MRRLRAAEWWDGTSSEGAGASEAGRADRPFRRTAVSARVGQARRLSQNRAKVCRPRRSLYPCCTGASYLHPFSFAPQTLQTRQVFGVIRAAFIAYHLSTSSILKERMILLSNNRKKTSLPLLAEHRRIVHPIYRNHYTTRPKRVQRTFRELLTQTYSIIERF